MELKCKYSFDQINDGSVHVNVGVREAVITEPGQEIRAFIKTNPVCRNTAKEVKTLFFVDQKNLHYLPVFRDLIQRHFPNLEELIIDNCRVTEISRQDLEGLQNLKKLEITNCDLTSLPDDLFTNMPNLQSVSFANNKIVLASFGKLLEPFLGRQNMKVDLSGNKNIDILLKI